MRIVLLLALLLAASGCGLTSSPADGLTFTAPPGWQASPGIMGFMQFWKAPDSKQVLMLFKSPKPVKESDVFSSAKMNDTTTEEQRTIQICGNQAAQYVRGRGTTSGDSGKKTDDNIQLVMTTAGGATYFAMYVYPLDMTPDAQAAAAIRELCLKP
jgi:hypothetical protein